MKYLPLIWAALARKPVRSILIFVSAAIGFTLFGLTIGVNAGFRHLADIARMDRLYVSSRYGAALTLAQRDQITRLPGITHVGLFSTIAGYHQNPANKIAVLMADSEMRAVFSELPVSVAQWHQLDLTQNGVFLSRMLAARYGVKAGDDFPIVTSAPSRADGSSVWNFSVLGIVDDIAFFPTGLAVGNYVFLDQSRPLGDRGTAGQLWLLTSDEKHVEETASAIDRLFANSSVPTRSNSEKAMFGNMGGPDSVMSIATEGIAFVGLLMIAFLTGNTIAQSVRERLHEFAVLKTLGYSDSGVIALLFAETATPCLLGAGPGLALAELISLLLPQLMPPGIQFPMPYISFPVLVSALIAALLLVLSSVALPALRLTRLNVASALARK